jgi:hypothetical protein
MDPRAGRRIVLLLIAAPIALAAMTTILIVHGPRAAFPTGRTAAGALVGHVDAPLAVISCDELPVKPPDPDEMRSDEQARPYHLRVRTLDFPSLEPVDVDATRIVVLGAGEGRRVGTGEYLFEGLPVGYTSVSLLAPQDPAAQRRPGFDGRAQRLAERNPVPLARHALTTCDLVVFGPEDLAWTGALRGSVVEDATRRAVPGARVACGSQVTLTDDHGRFEFAAPVSWADLSRETAVTCAGYKPFVLLATCMPCAWLRDVVGKGEATFRLRTADPGEARAIVPALPR